MRVLFQGLKEYKNSKKMLVIVHEHFDGERTLYVLAVSCGYVRFVKSLETKPTMEHALSLACSELDKYGSKVFVADRETRKRHRRLDAKYGRA